MKYEEETRDCIICGSSCCSTLRTKKPWQPLVFIDDEDGRVYHKTDVVCDDCGMVYKNPMMTRETQRDFYDKDYAMKYKSRLQAGIPGTAVVDGVMTTVYTLDWLKEIGYDLKGKSVLEIGGGMGTLMRGMRSMGAEVYGMDPDRRSCELAMKVNGIEVEHGRFHKDHKDCKKYDLVVMCNVIEHMYDPGETLESVRLLLNDGGQALVEVPSVMFPYPLIASDAFLSSAHNYTFSYRTFKSLAARCGFQVDSFDYAGHKKCMFFLLSENPDADMRLDGVSREEIAGALDENDLLIANIKDIQMNHFPSLDTYSSRDMLKKYTYFSNVLLVRYVHYLLENKRYNEALDLSGEWKMNQSEDVDYCEGSFLGLQSLAHRQLGDFVAARDCLKRAIDKCPKLETYNFYKEMLIEGSCYPINSIKKWATDCLHIPV